MRQFIVGLLTHHVVTKIVSLLLAVVLFVFVQQSISETQRIEELVIEFDLSAEAAKKWVLIEDTVVLKDVTVRGLREILTREMSALRSKQGFRFKKRIDDDFLKRYPPANGIEINAALCRAEGIPWQLGKDFELGIEDPPRLDIKGRENRTLRPTFSEDVENDLKLPAGFRFVRQGPAVLELKEVPTISVSGPGDALPPEDAESVLPLYVKIRPLREVLEGAGTESEARANHPIAEIDWEASGFAPDRLQFVRVESPRVGKVDLKAMLSYTCAVEIRRQPLLLTVPLLFLTGGKQLVEEKYRFEGAVGVKNPNLSMDGIRTVDIDLEVTPRWKAQAEELKKFLAIEVDFAAAQEDADRINAPIALRPAPNAPVGLLNEVRLARGDDPDAPAFRFRKKK